VDAVGLKLLLEREDVICVLPLCLIGRYLLEIFKTASLKVIVPWVTSAAPMQPSPLLSPTLSPMAQSASHVTHSVPSALDQVYSAARLVNMPLY